MSLDSLNYLYDQWLRSSLYQTLQFHWLLLICETNLYVNPTFLNYTTDQAFDLGIEPSRGNDMANQVCSLCNLAT